jgi:hypothetical protein
MEAVLLTDLEFGRLDHGPNNLLTILPASEGWRIMARCRVFLLPLFAPFANAIRPIAHLCHLNVNVVLSSDDTRFRYTPRRAEHSIKSRRLFYLENVEGGRPLSLSQAVTPRKGDVPFDQLGHIREPCLKDRTIDRLIRLWWMRCVRITQQHSWSKEWIVGKCRLPVLLCAPQPPARLRRRHDNE